MRVHETAGIAAPDVLLPRPGIDLTRWAVVACDQYTSQPGYWDEVRTTVGGQPSTLDLVYPEVYLGEPDPDARIARIHASMREVLATGVLQSHEGFVFVERTVAGRVRRGLVACLDLGRYDYSRGSTSLVRATEGTILERLPPRVRIRKGAALELPHILVLVDDPGDEVIGPLARAATRLDRLYDFDLMQGGGHLAGYRVADAALENGVVGALERLADRQAFHRKYDVPAATPVLLFAVGDGNHSLATAKAIWQEVERERGAEAANDPARWALVELENLHDEALVFEPIHRVLFEIAGGRDPIEELATALGSRARRVPVPILAELRRLVATSDRGTHRIGVVRPVGYELLEVTGSSANLPVGTLQAFLDPFVAAGGAKHIDYVHGADVVDDLGRKPGNVGFVLPAMDKHELFRSVILDGVLPRKTFSMGEAHEKRFYMECRRIG
jgi:hypothetical protein